MMPQSLTPSVQHGQEANLGAQVFRVSGYRAQGLGGGGEEQVVNNSLVLQRQRRKLLWQGKHHMEILHWQEVSQARFEPAGFRQRLTLRAMTIATRVVRDALVTTGVTLVHMTAEHAGTTDFNRAHHPPLLWRPRVGEPEVGTVLAEDVGHL
jgi:hypothetical protein